MPRSLDKKRLDMWMPEELHERLSKAAREGHRPLTQEIIMRLEQSFAADDETPIYIHPEERKELQEIQTSILRARVDGLTCPIREEKLHS